MKPRKDGDSIRTGWPVIAIWSMNSCGTGKGFAPQFMNAELTWMRSPNQNRFCGRLLLTKTC